MRKKGRPHTNKTFGAAINKMMAKATEEHEDRNDLIGPHYCSKYGEYSTVDDVANPSYDPHVIFGDDPKKVTSPETYIYHPSSNSYHKSKTVDTSNRGELPSPRTTLMVVKRKTIPTWILDEIFNRIPKIFNGDEIGNFSKFVFPVMRRAFPKLIAQDIISVQPMTSPVSSVFYYKTRYGKTNDTK